MPPTKCTIPTECRSRRVHPLR
ncbi:MAG: hypothetical protein E7580_00200 [Ruminococcaceae bacterium]|nr:hypothetical protein [Oscillospiraceae bacterium]